MVVRGRFLRGVCLQEVPNIVIDFETFGILENWSLWVGSSLQEVVTTGSSTVTKYHGNIWHKIFSAPMILKVIKWCTHEINLR